jgi:hypothetical protein
VEVAKDIEIVIGVVSAIVGALLGALVSYYLTLRIERRKERVERARVAHQACLQLRETLANWKNEIADATRQGRSAADVKRQLQALFEHDKYKREISDRFYVIGREPLCQGLFGKTNAFTNQAFESKGVISMTLGSGKFLRNYESHRNEARQALDRIYDSFNNELERVIPLLEQEMRL